MRSHPEEEKIAHEMRVAVFSDRDLRRKPMSDRAGNNRMTAASSPDT
jgi:hypothetical protein